jgi:hypothetical protein
LCLVPSHQCCLPDPPDVSSRTSIPFGFHLQIYFSSDPSVILVRPTVRHDCVICAVPLLHSGSSLFRRGELLSRSTLFQGPNFPDDVSFSPCHFCTLEQLPTGGGQLSPGSTISRALSLASDGAPRKDSGPFAASSVLRPASLRPLPWGPPDAPLWTSSFLDRAQSPSLHCEWSSHSALTVRIVLWFHFTLDGLLQLRPECRNWGTHSAWPDLISSCMACVFSCILANISSCLAFDVAWMASVYAFILAFNFCRSSWWAFLSASLFS